MLIDTIVRNLTHCVFGYIASVPIARIAMKEMEFVTPFAALCVFLSAYLNYETVLNAYLFDALPWLRNVYIRATATLLIAIACYLKEIRGFRPAARNLAGR